MVLRSPRQKTRNEELPVGPSLPLESRVLLHGAMREKTGSCTAREDRSYAAAALLPHPLASLIAFAPDEAFAALASRRRFSAALPDPVAAAVAAETTTPFLSRRSRTFFFFRGGSPSPSAPAAAAAPSPPSSAAAAFSAASFHLPVLSPFSLSPSLTRLFLAAFSRSSLSFFRCASILARRASELPPPPAVSSTLILRPEMEDWCNRRAVWSALVVVNSIKAQPFDAGGLSPEVAFGVRRRTVGTSPA